VTVAGQLVYSVGSFYSALIIIYVLMSWLPMSGGFIYDVYRVLGSVVEPYLGVFRRVIPPMGGLDFSPVVAIILLNLVVRQLALLL